jgi:hypothetical protein
MKTYKLAYIKDGNTFEWSCQANDSRHAIEQLQQLHKGQRIRITLCKQKVYSTTLDLMRMHNMPY